MWSELSEEQKYAQWSDYYHESQYYNETSPLEYVQYDQWRNSREK